MKETIEFKKEIILKTNVHEIVEVNLTHEYKVMDDVVEGDFYVTGEYKMTEASVKLEEFYYKIPFAIALSDRIKKESVNLVIEEFNYEVNKDVLMLKMDLGMNYEEVSDVIDDVIEEVIDEEVIEKLEDESENVMEENVVLEQIEENNENIDVDIEVIDEKEKEELQEEIDNIASKFNMPDGYVTYKIHIVKSEETYESIALKYEVGIEDLLEYNDSDVLSIGDKVVIPYVKNE